MKVLIVSIIFISGCSQLLNGQIQPVTVKDAAKKIMFTTCSGSVEDWGVCNRKALATCEKGYFVLEKLDNANGGVRELTFKCN